MGSLALQTLGAKEVEAQTKALGVKDVAPRTLGAQEARILASAMGVGEQSFKLLSA